MARLDLSVLPAMALPPGFVARHYRPGDEAAWERITDICFGGEFRAFGETMAAKSAFRPERVWFIETAARLVATATAWRDERFGLRTGYLHMVAVLPEARGRQLGFWVSLAAMHQFVREGVSHAVLQTDDERLPAIATYRRLGFQPLIVDDDQLARWETLLGLVATRPPVATP